MAAHRYGIHVFPRLPRSDLADVGALDPGPRVGPSRRAQLPPFITSPGSVRIRIAYREGRTASDFFIEKTQLNL